MNYQNFSCDGICSTVYVLPTDFSCYAAVHQQIVKQQTLLKTSLIWFLTTSMYVSH